MSITNYGKQEFNLLLSSSGVIPQYCAIGSGSGADLSTLSGLVAEVGATRTAYTTRDTGTVQQTSWIYDFNSVTMSGITLREFGVGGSQAINSGDLWNREAFVGIEFDGTNELQIEIIFKTY